MVYLICFPLIFFAHVCYSLFSLGFYFVWFVLMVNIYLVTLGGVKWQPYIMEAKFDEERTWNVKPSNKAANAFVIILFIVLVASLCCTGTSFIFEALLVKVAGSTYEFVLFMLSFFASVGLIFYYAYLALVLIVNPLLFRKKEIKTDK